MAKEKKANRKEKPEKPKPQSPQSDEVVGETVGTESFRRLQLVDGTPSDLEDIVQKEKSVAEFDVKKEHDWVTIAFAVGLVMVFFALAMIFLGKVDFGNIFGGGGGTPPVTPEPLPAMIAGLLPW